MSDINHPTIPSNTTIHNQMNQASIVTSVAAAASTPVHSSSAAASAPPSISSSSSSSTPSSSSSSSPSAPVLTSLPSKSLESRTVALSGEQLTYLNIMSQRYSLGSLDKTARCLVNYADKDGDHRFIFATYRCRTCGIKFPKKEISLQLYPHQWAFLDRMKVEHKINDPQENGKSLRVLLDFTQEGRTKRGMTDAQKAEVLNALELEIFTKIRCNDPVCTHQH